MSKRTSNDDVINSLVGDFYSKVGLQKTAETGPQGATASDVKKKEGVDIVSGPSQTGRGAEMTQDAEKALNGEATPVSEGQVTSSDVMKDAPGQVTRLSADDKAKCLGTVENTVVNNAAASEVAKVARAQRLSNSILGMISEMSAQPAPIQKSAEEARQEQESYNAFAEFSRGYNRGIQKKAEDMQEVMDSGVVPSPEAAEDVLNAVAVQDPEAVLPEEAQPEAGIDPETAQALDQLADAMAAEGVTPEQLAEAANVVQELQAQGVSPEEIIAAVDQAGGETGAGPEAAPEEAAPIDEAAMKVASEQRVNHALGRITQYLKRGN